MKLQYDKGPDKMTFDNVGTVYLGKPTEDIPLHIAKSLIRKKRLGFREVKNQKPKGKEE